MLWQFGPPMSALGLQYIIKAVSIIIRIEQWCIAKNGGGYTQRSVVKGLKVPCLIIYDH